MGTLDFDRFALVGLVNGTFKWGPFNDFFIDIGRFLND